MRHFLRFTIHDFFSNPWVWKIFLFLGIVFRFLYIFYGNGVAAEQSETFLLSILQNPQNILFVSPLPVTVYENFFSSVLNVFAVGASIFGMDDYRSLLTSISFFSFVFSLLFVWGGFLLSKNVTLEKPYAYFALSVFALHFAMPIISITPYPQTLAMFFIPWGFYFLTKQFAQPKHYFWGAVLLSFSSLFYVPNIFFVAITFFYLLYKFFSSKKTRTYIYSFLMGIVPAVVLMTLLDILAKKFPFATIVNFFQQLFYASYNPTALRFYVAIFLLIFIPPFSFFLLKSFWRGITRTSLLTLNFFGFSFFFLFSQNISAYNAGIFFLPLFPLFVVLTASGLSTCSKRSWANVAVALSLIVNFALLVLSF